MLDMNYRKKALLAMVLMLLIPAGQVALADSAAASSCPGPTGHVKKSLMRLVDKWGDAENELSTPQTAVTRSLENEEIRMLMPGKDEKACRALYRQGHSAHMEKTWNEELNIQGEVYPYYDVGYYRVGDYYVAAFVVTPIPQENTLAGEIRATTAYSTMMIYDTSFTEISRHAL